MTETIKRTVSVEDAREALKDMDSGNFGACNYQASYKTAGVVRKCLEAQAVEVGDENNS